MPQYGHQEWHLVTGQPLTLHWIIENISNIFKNGLKFKNELWWVGGGWWYEQLNINPQKDLNLNYVLVLK